MGFSDQTVKPKKTDGNNKEKKSEEKNGDVIEGEEETAVKSYPLTIDFMKTIDGRTTRIPNYGSLVGRIARLIGMVVKKEVHEDTVDIKCTKCDSVIDSFDEVFPHIETKHGDFLNHLYSMFPPAKKRMDQFVLKAVENFDLVVPTWEHVERMQKIEKEKQEKLRREEMNKKLEEAKKAREELKKKREEAEEQ